MSNSEFHTSITIIIIIMEGTEVHIRSSLSKSHTVSGCNTQYKYYFTDISFS